MALVRSRNERKDLAAQACCNPDGLRICTLPRGSPKKNVSSFTFHLNSWRLEAPASSAKLAAFLTPPERLAAATADFTPPEKLAASTADAAPDALRASRFAKSPSWLFGHYSHFDASQAHKPQPRAASLLATRSRLRVQRAANASLDEPLPFGTFNGLPPVYMVHLAALRSGAWQRRAVLRAHGWWHPQADRLAADALGWGQRRGLLMLSASNVVRPASGNTFVSSSELPVIVGNLVLLAALTGRVAVVPEVACDSIKQESPTLTWKETRRRRQERRCAWLPPKPCWQLEYVTTLELQRRALLEPPLAKMLRSLRNRTELRSWRAQRNAPMTPSPPSPALSHTGDGSGQAASPLPAESNSSSPFVSAWQKAWQALRPGRRLAQQATVCEAGVALDRLLKFSPRAPASPSTTAGAQTEAPSERSLSRLRALPCETGRLASLEDRATEELLRRQRLILPDHAPDPRASEWLLRDAKCISALLGEGQSAKSGASRKQGRHI